MALHIYSRVQDKKEMAKVAALVCETLCSYERMGKQFRAEILNIIQSDYNSTSLVTVELGAVLLLLLLLLLSYHRRLRMILRSARAARGRRSG